MPFHGWAGANQYCVVWVRTGAGGADGQPVVSPVGREIMVRFDFSRRMSTAPDGTQVSVDATMSGFSMEVPVGSAVYRGRASDLSGTGTINYGDVYRVVSAEDDYDWRGEDRYREVGLTRAANALPAQALAGT